MSVVSDSLVALATRKNLFSPLIFPRWELIYLKVPPKFGYRKKKKKRRTAVLKEAIVKVSVLLILLQS